MTNCASRRMHSQISPASGIVAEMQKKFAYLRTVLHTAEYWGHSANTCQPISQSANAPYGGHIFSFLLLSHAPLNSAFQQANLFIYYMYDITQTQKRIFTCSFSTQLRISSNTYSRVIFCFPDVLIRCWWNDECVMYRMYFRMILWFIFLRNSGLSFKNGLDIKT